MSSLPSTSPTKVSIDIIADLKLISEVFQKVEEETAEVAEMIFGYLIDIDDEHIINGTIPNHQNPKLQGYIKILNRLFRLSKKRADDGAINVIIINRKAVQALDKKTYAISMCFDGGVSLDIMCDIVNEENRARTPTKSPVKITIKKAFGEHQRTK
ncbi:MAG: hypothetical protein A2887_02620 [Alphaproteobacteria bacterium RIFCSPLOWO2_01_FULL_40_26]|nr:MAG: hypothetical protein A3D15_03390 [Alphaproteobacteria bacterium RIFCSPHIGHO2_02_FULL_40_34]OFW94878.1 MAG: hypothetical protein A2887_02620 [Alphaproteobacteria bacterium RIFCSPLOWO2_01_FULL_40_26]OFX10504.1 MAG: hypothetical protein A3H30_04030 [Alphaproteobacteria bacterium RIFCSPLOWO2_02_FULL_40_19]OFX10879.1 MAG: hypothetical protein A3G22_00875 [Alphaproteobacteria bacterium RIFCSPLOWO2_12_FULL_40_11]